MTYLTLDKRYGVTEFDPSNGYPVLSLISTLVADDQVIPIMEIAATSCVTVIVSDEPITLPPTDGSPSTFASQAELDALTAALPQTYASYSFPQAMTQDQIDRVLANIKAAKTITPESMELGNDDDDWDAVLQLGSSVTDIIFIQLTRTYTWTRTHAWDSDHGNLFVLGYGGAIVYTGTGSAFTALTHSGGNNVPSMRWLGGSYIGATATRFFDCTDVRSSKWYDCKFNTPVGTAIYMLNVNAFSERNQAIDCTAFQCQQFLVAERGFKTTTNPVTFAVGANKITDAATTYNSGDWIKFATVGTSGLTANQTYYVGTVTGNDFTVYTTPADAWGNFAGSPVTISAASTAGSVYIVATGSFARLQVTNLYITGGVYGYAQVQFKNCGPYDSRIGPFYGNVSNGVGMVDFIGGRTQGDSELGPFLCETSDDGKKVTGLASTNVVTISAAPVSRPLAVGQAVQLTSLVGGSGVVSEKVYYIKTLPSATTFTLSTTPGGSTLALGTDITAGFFWNYRPWVLRWGQSSGAAPIFHGVPTLRGLALYDPGQFNADGVTPSVPDGTVTVLQKHQLIGGVVSVNSQHYTGVDIPTPVQAIPSSPINPALIVSGGGALDFGSAWLQAAHAKTVGIIDGLGNTVLQADGAGNVSGTAITGRPGAPLAVAEIDFGSTKPSATTVSTTGSDITADAITAGWTGVVANSLDCSFVAPANGIVQVTIEAQVQLSASATALRFQISDVTGTPALVTNSLMTVFQGPTTSVLRVRYSRKFTGLVASQTYVWRPQWLTSSGAVTATMNIGAQNGPVRMSVVAWQ